MTCKETKLQPFDSIQWENLQRYCNNVLYVSNLSKLNVIFKLVYLNTFATPKPQKLVMYIYLPNC